MPYTSRQMDYFRFKMHDKDLSPKERERYRKMYEEGRRARKRPTKKGR